MSQENVEIVRRFNAPSERQSLIPTIRADLEQYGYDPQPEAVLAVWAEDPTWQHVHPDIEWDTGLGTVARGPRELVQWWADWVEGWESYVYPILGYSDLGDWVMPQPRFARWAARAFR
jgi:hypothetical protein